MNYFETLEQSVVSFSTSGDNIVIPAPGVGKYLMIDFLLLVPTADVTITFKSGATPISGAMPFKANQVIVLENAIKNEHGVITCPGNAPFIINTGGGVDCEGMVRYRIYNK